jgi:predicted enzyme related to lactoylglutathione lyase
VPGHDDERGVGEMSWHELATTDYLAAFGYYEKLFG